MMGETADQSKANGSELKTGVELCVCVREEKAGVGIGGGEVCRVGGLKVAVDV